MVTTTDSETGNDEPWRIRWELPPDAQTREDSAVSAPYARSHSFDHVQQTSHWRHVSRDQVSPLGLPQDAGPRSSRAGPACT